MGVTLFDYQRDAVNRLKPGSILIGGVGSGKSITSLAYFYKWCAGDIEHHDLPKRPSPLIIITTAKKRDSLEWHDECANFGLSVKKAQSCLGIEVVIDSWNNISKYKDRKNAFFIFDEQRLVGYGSWVKAFLAIAKNNKWILLTATPGDVWMDYLPVFLANGFYKNKSDFVQQHVMYSRFTKFPKVLKYLKTQKLERLKRMISVTMDYHHEIERSKQIVPVEYDHNKMFMLKKRRWNFVKDEPIKTISEFCYLQRYICNSDPSRILAVRGLMLKHDHIVVFYNFMYELELLRALDGYEGFCVHELNGEKHDNIPQTKKWIYLVQYTAGAEGWNCVQSDCTIFYSLNYSYRIMTQAAGRIDRLNTKFTTLYYYYLISDSKIDKSIKRAIKNKKRFNERNYTQSTRRFEASHDIHMV